MVRQGMEAAAVAVVIAMMTGCAPAPGDSGFGAVRQIASARTGQIVEWRGQTMDDAAVDAAIDQMLRRPLAADDAVQIALLNSRHLQATYEDLGIAQADLVQAGLLKNPVFNLSVRFPLRPPSLTYLDMAVAEDFLDVFFLPARKKIAQSQFHQSQSRVTHEVLLLAGQTREAFYRFQSAQKVVELRKTAAEAAADASAASKALHDAGNITDLEWFSQQTQEARTKAEWVAAQAEADDARERVNELMGISGPRLSWTAGSDLPPLPPKDPLLTDLETLAVDQRMDLAAAREQVATQGQVLGLTRQTSLLGGLELGAQAERETDGQWRIGPDLNVNVPIFDQGQAAVARAFAEFGQSRRRYEALEADVRSQVRRAAQRVRNARVRADDYEKQVLPLQRKLVRQMQLEYNSMLTGVFALLQARRDEIDAGREYIESLRDYWIARVELEQAVGGRLKVVNLVATQPAQSQP